MFRGRSKALFAAGLLTLAYGICLIVYFARAAASGSGSEQAGGMIAAALVTPHMACVILAGIFLMLGFFIRKAWAALTGAVLISVSGVLFIMYAMLTVPLIVLAWIGYAKQKQLSANA